MPRPKPEGPIKNFQMKLTAEESRRWQKVYDQAKKRNRHINETQVNRILLGLDQEDDAVTEKDRIFFRGVPGTSGMLGHVVPAKPHIQEVSSPKKKRK